MDAKRQMRSASARMMADDSEHKTLFFPRTLEYKIWRGLTVFAAILTVIWEPYQVAFLSEVGNWKDTATLVEYGLTSIFVLDIAVNFNLAFYDDEVLVTERSRIAKSYSHDGMFWVDLVGILPFQAMALGVLGETGMATTPNGPNNLVLFCSLLCLLRLVRVHRVGAFSDRLQYNARISLLWFTLIRNFAVLLTVTHISACIMYFLARLHGFGNDTWLGPHIYDLNGFERYVTALYWSVTSFTTVGYGDFAPVNAEEQIFGCIVMLLNIIVQSWIFGSITLLVVKGDEKTSDYRDSLLALDQYSIMHQFDSTFQKKLKRQLRLEFNNREIADEQVLKQFPSVVRRKVMRRLYLSSLIKTNLMKGLQPQFVDSFLNACAVEIFSPGEEILERGSVSSDLFLLVRGVAEITTPENDEEADLTTFDPESRGLHRDRELLPGDFLGEIGFFSETSQHESVRCVTVCKTLTISRSAYNLVAQDHPGSAGKILQNLLTKVEELQIQPSRNQSMPYSQTGDTTQTAFLETNQGQREALIDLIKMHMQKQRDDQTTRLLFAASRGDLATISLMCDEGFDANNADYDHRTALMVASMKGNTEVVKLLLADYSGNPNLVDVHGSSALYEAVKNGHEQTMDLLLEYGADLCMQESLAASVLCQAVSDGDILFLRRLLRANIQVNASDYDKRTAAHIASAEGNVAALKVLMDHGADLRLEDRWRNTVYHEAKRSSAGQILTLLNGLDLRSTKGRRNFKLWKELRRTR